MKRAYFILLLNFSLFTHCCRAQVTMVGMSQKGGFSNHGTIFSVNSSGNIETLYNFNEGINGCVPHGGLVQDSDGSLYGVAAGCGIHNVGTLIKYNGENHGITKLVDFHNTIGANPVGDLVIGSDGALYGMTNSGGINDFGTIFKCTTDGKLTTIANFTRGNGSYPKGSLVKDCCGNFYGMTRLGGDYDKGVIFKCTSSGVVTVLHSFNGNDGAMPEGNLIIVKDSLLYGVSKIGGNGGGSIFLCSVSGKFILLNSFNNKTGIKPSGSLLNGGDGYLYGATDTGGAFNYGTLFRCTESGRISVLVNFNDTNGADPQGTLSKGPDGIIYGMTRFGGGYSDAGIIFKYTVSTGKLETLTEFTSTNAQMTSGSLTEMKLNTDLKELASNKKLGKHNTVAKKGSRSGMGEL